MILPDVNILVYAFRHDAAHHSISRMWLNNTTAGDSRFAISKLSLAAFVRIVTNGRSYPDPTPPAAAFAFCSSLLAQPNCVTIEPGERHWEIFQRLCIETNTRGPMTTDAWYAALAIEWACEWLTFDRDFARFPGLKYRLFPFRSA